MLTLTKISGFDTSATGGGGAPTARSFGPDYSNALYFTSRWWEMRSDRQNPDG